MTDKQIIKPKRIKAYNTFIHCGDVVYATNTTKDEWNKARTMSRRGGDQ